MALKDQIPFGMSLPHRSPDTIGVDVVRAVATKADALGFRDLWVTENTLDHVNSFDPLTVLTYAAGITSRIGLGASVLVLPVHDPRMVAHQWATLDYVSGGRAIMGVGIGRPFHFEEFEVPQEGRVARFREQIDLIRTLWSQEKVEHKGSFYHLEGTKLGVRPVQQPLPIWMGVGHPNAIRRAAGIADGWMGAGGSTSEDFRRAVPLLREALEKAGRDPNGFPISKRIFIAVDEKPDIARAELNRWYTEVYRNPPGTDTSGIHGTPEQVRERLQEMIGQGANHLLLNPVSRHVEQLHALAEVVGLS
ncbi:MAG TPA: LLM class flavin-dependent oxidoreductase [Acetobacteraceae bacterium]|jgi:probable F420-dependent oxidoreductase|nr:LLM class flavin-dependent oxidoreductase [Acetobacteraceae bacterium]